MNSNPWIKLVNQLALSKTEKAVVQRFAADPEGRAFLPVSDILRSHRKNHEALELLIHGVQLHPQFVVARVVLAREYFNHGMIQQTWDTLMQSPVSLQDNALAQKLLFKSSLLNLDQMSFENVSHQLKKLQLLDQECKDLLFEYESGGIESAAKVLIHNLKQKGITPILSQEEVLVSREESAEFLPRDKVVQEDKVVSAGLDLSGIKATQIIEKSSTKDLDTKGKDFYVMSLSEVFRGGDEKAWGYKTVGGIELDSTTLGEIYARQGHFAKALSVYKRLLSLSPSSELLRKRVQELSSLDKQQRIEEEGIDPEVFDVMENQEYVDRKIKFYQDMMNSLERYPSRKES